MYVHEPVAAHVPRNKKYITPMQNLVLILQQNQCHQDVARCFSLPNSKLATKNNTRQVQISKEGMRDYTVIHDAHCRTVWPAHPPSPPCLILAACLPASSRTGLVNDKMVFFLGNLSIQSYCLNFETLFLFLLCPLICLLLFNLSRLLSS